MSKKSLSPSREECHVESLLTRSLRESPVVGGESPVDSPLLRRAAMSLLLGVRASDTSLNDSVASWSMDEPTTDESSRGSPRRAGGISPDPIRGHRRHSMKQYKNELWAAIRPDFMYLMDEEIIDACKSTESEFSSDDISAETKVSYNEFLQQYKELTDWLGSLQRAVSRQTASCSESYLNQMYHEEMLKQSPRQQLFKDYAKELMCRYPQLKQEIMQRISHVSELWCEVMDKLVLPSGGGQPDLAIILNDIEKDVTSLRNWVNTAEKIMSSLCFLPDWSLADIRAKLIEHQVIQKDIESRSRVVSAVMKLCEWMDQVGSIGNALEQECQRLHEDAVHLEQRWHSVWIQSVEWQVRLEDALAGNYPTKNRFLSDEDLWGSSVHQSSVSVDRFKARERLRNRLYVHDSVSEFTDGTNSDVIPFCDSEYEEIIYSDQGDTDDQHELEVELGRNEHSMERDQITLDGWMEMRLENEMQGNISDQNISMKEQSSEFIEAATTSAQKTNNVSSGGLEILDIGYSSESHSYDEREACHDHATHMMRTNEHLKLDEMNCREDFGAEICETVGLFSVGQQSLTSAYNSASDLSENHRAALVNDIPGRRVRSSYCGGTAMDCVDSAATSSADQYPRHFAAGCGTVDDCCTDDDFSKLKELSFDDIPMMFMKEESEDDCNVTSEHSTVLQLPRRSLDSLLPCDNEKLFKMEKRVSSVEIIMDTLGGSKESPASICGEIHLRNPFVNTLLTNTETDTAALSSCDASSEGTLSESESSESAVSEDDTSPRKFKSARRLRRENNKHETPSKRACTGHMRSPLKRRGDSLTDVSDIGEYERPLRSSSDGAISDLANDHTTVKRSKVCRAQSDISCERSVRASSSNRSVRKGGIQSEHHGFRTSSKKNHQSTIKQLLNFSGDGLEDVITVNASNYDAMVSDVDQEAASCKKSRAVRKAGWDSDDDSVSVTDDCSLDTSKDDGKDALLKCDRSSLIISNRNASMRSLPTWQDSDSDMEDFLNIVSESRKAYTFTETTLQKFHKDHTDGIVRDPVEFMGPLATCQTNINCMMELVDALQSGARMQEADKKIYQIKSIVSRWQELEAQTVAEQQQCRLMYILYTERIRSEKQLSVLLQEINVDRFDDLQSLETMCRTVQAVRCELQSKVDHQLRLLAHKVEQFQTSHPDVDMNRFSAAIEKLQQTAAAILDLCNRKESHLKKSLMAWYQLNELQCHLEYVIAHEEHQIDCLDVATDIVHLSEADFTDTVGDLQLMRDGWSVHNDKLQLMESLRRELVDVCTVSGQMALESSVNHFDNRLQSLRRRCDQMIERMTNSSMIVSANERDDDAVPSLGFDGVSGLDDNWTDEEDGGEVPQQDGVNNGLKGEMKTMLEEAAEVGDRVVCDNEELVKHDHVEEVSALKATSRPNVLCINPAPSNALRRLLKYALPLPLLLMLLFGGLYLLCDDWFDYLDQFGLRIYPQLHHVRGAPPI